MENGLRRGKDTIDRLGEGAVTAIELEDSLAEELDEFGGRRIAVAMAQSPERELFCCKGNLKR
jgi:hypothetical protein